MSDQKDASVAAIIAAKRAEIAAKLARFQQPNGQPSSPGTATPATVHRPPTTPARTTTYQEPVNKYKAPARSSNVTPLPLPPSARPGAQATGGGLNLLEMQRMIAEAKERLATGTPTLHRATATGFRAPESGATKAAPQIALDESGNIDLKAMLDKGIIPKRETAISKVSQRQAPAKKEAKALKIEPHAVEDFKDTTKNPYFDPSLNAKAAPSMRRSRPLKFVQPGKYIQQANQERAKAQLEKLKQITAESVKKAGMETEMDISDKAIKKDPPPAVEWWDAPLLPNKTYSQLDDAPVNPDNLSSLVTLYVHHPIPIRPPSEQNGPPVLRSLMLTKKERKKLRRQRRQEAQKEKQDKIRLGLLPPDPPKVKISNLMRVLGDEAIQDPTKIEAKVRKEMEMRQKKHEMANEQRKLTPEERRAKILNKLKENQKISNEVAVFKINNCSHPKHRFKIETNAQQHQLSGMVIVNPRCSIVIVEGGPKGIKAYKKLMLRRIDWNDMPPPKHGSTEDSGMDLDMYRGNGQEENRCFLVWEGQVKNKAFRKFTWRTFASEKMARDELSKWHVEHYWDAAALANDEELAAKQHRLVNL
ncbi:hypothetical protein EC973_003044 [Apophysomyces ossiformis]|uniref:Uncharacterized protein n=1 Tax=Apophysomyces ossiformis TaxID=679940 RepID=A0A8H7ETN0_9FUNG|nr:hypothetical protein EC973_003044 [Apophysomyces ossiformis]